MHGVEPSVFFAYANFGHNSPPLSFFLHGTHALSCARCMCPTRRKVVWCGPWPSTEVVSRHLSEMTSAYEIAVYTLVSTLMGVVLVRAASALAWCCLARVEIEGRARCKRMDALMLPFARSVLISGIERVPAEGLHVVVSSWAVSFVIKRVFVDPSGRSDSRTTYTVWSTSRKAAMDLSDRSAPPSPRSVTVIKYECLAPFAVTTDLHCRELPGDMLPAQKQCAFGILTLCLAERKRDRVAVIVSGAPGTGKSSMGYFIASILSQAEPGVTPRVVVGFDLCLKGASLMHILDSEIPAQQPVVLVLDEIDTAFEMADKGDESKTDFRCYAQTKTSLCNVLDTLATTPNLYVIATTNVPAEDLKKQYPAYTRLGRFHVLSM